MLILSRKANERIVINDNIVVTVIAIRGDKIRLGIEAPDNVPVHRLEIWQAIQRNAALDNWQARQAAPALAGAGPAGGDPRPGKPA